MKKNDFYRKAHLVAAAIRILEHRESAPASIEGLSHLLLFSPEEILRLCRRMADMDIIQIMEKAGDLRIFLKDHLKIEDIPVAAESSTMASELMKFMQSRENQQKKIDALAAEQAEKKKKRNQELEQKLKDVLKKK